MTGNEDATDVAQQIADLNAYGQALNQCATAEEVVSLTLEAMSLLFEFPSATVVEVRDGERQVADSTHPDVEPGDPADEASRLAIDRRETVTVTDAAAALGDGTGDAVALAVPAVVVDEVLAVLVTRSTAAEGFDDADVRPLEILASHAAIALGNIRSREALERAHRDLEARAELIELYDRLLRHDLRNALNVISGYAGNLARDLEGEPAEQAEAVGRTARESVELVERVEAVIASTDTAEEPEPRSLPAVLESAVEAARAQRDDLAVTIDTEGEYTVAGGDLLESVFVNLLTNAAQHNADAVTVRIEVTAPGPDSVVVSIADDGTGIDPSIADELFEMGVTGPDGGTGLGLGFVQRLVESYGGSVSVGESAEGGAEFAVTLRRV